MDVKVEVLFILQEQEEPVWQFVVNVKEVASLTECLYCELQIHGNCQRGDCSCPCEGDRNKFIKQQDSE